MVYFKIVTKMLTEINASPLDSYLIFDGDTSLGKNKKQKWVSGEETMLQHLNIILLMYS